jgi:hypothetical protein
VTEPCSHQNILKLTECPLKSLRKSLRFICCVTCVLTGAEPESDDGITWSGLCCRHVVSNLRRSAGTERKTEAETIKLLLLEHRRGIQLQQAADEYSIKCTQTYNIHSKIARGLQVAIWLQWLYIPCGPRSQFLNLYTVGSTPWTGDQPVAMQLPTHRTTQTQINAHIHPCLEWDSNPRFQCSSGRRRLMP